MNSELAIVHTADWHVCDEFLEDATACLDFLVAKTEKIIPELVVIAGDIYNHRQVRQESEAARLAIGTIRRLARVAPVIILSGTPSHDGKAPLLIRNVNEGFPVYVMDQPETICLYAEKFGADHEFMAWQSPPLRDDLEPVALISGVPAFTKQYFQSGSDIQTSDQEIATALGSIFASMGANRNQFNINLRQQGHSPIVPHILMGHWSIGGAFIHPSQALTGLDIEVAREHIALAKPDIVCMGHIHAQQKIGDNIFYPGSLFATDFGEMEAKGFYVHGLELVDMGGHWELKVEDFIHTPSPLLIRLKDDLLNAETKEAVKIAIISTIQTLTSNPHAIIRHDIKIYQDMAHAINEQGIKDLVADKVGPRDYQMNIARLPRPNVRSARVLEVETLRDKLTARATIINEDITEEVLLKADMLEELEPEELYESIKKEVVI